MYRRSNGQPLALGQQVGAIGGEGRILAVSNEPRLVAKIYHQATPWRTAKLRAMVANPPTDPTSLQGHVSIAWPTELVHDEHGACVGFLMPKINFDTSIPALTLYHPKSRLQRAPNFTWEYLLRTTRNLASVIEAVHMRGYVVGDLNESNLLVSNSALITIVDCDSMQVRSPSGQVFPCTVGKGEYTPPELQGANFSSVIRNPVHDNFGLAVLIFMLLMEGTHPFDGKWHGSGVQPSREENIKSGRSPYVGASNISPPMYAPPFSILPPQVQSLMVRCFGAGHQNPSIRPTPGEWQHALESAEQHLAVCRSNDRHRYSQHLGSACPWCARMQHFRGHDPFPKPSQQRALPPTSFTVPLPITPTGAGGYRPTSNTAPPRVRSRGGSAAIWRIALVALLALVAWIAIPQFTKGSTNINGGYIVPATPYNQGIQPTAMVFPTDTSETMTALQSTPTSEIAVQVTPTLQDYESPTEPTSPGATFPLVEVVGLTSDDPVLSIREGAGTRFRKVAAAWMGQRMRVLEDRTQLSQGYEWLNVEWTVSGWSNDGGSYEWLIPQPINIGDYVTVNVPPVPGDDFLALRAFASVGSAELGRLERGKMYRVIDGPRFASDGISGTWWKLEVTEEGWSYMGNLRRVDK